MSLGKVSLIESLHDEIATKMSQVLSSTKSAVNIAAKVYAAQAIANMSCSSDEQITELIRKLQNSAEVKAVFMRNDLTLFRLDPIASFNKQSAILSSSCALDSIRTSIPTQLAQKSTG